MKLIKVTAPSICVRKGSKIQVDNDLQWIVEKVGLLQDDGTWVLQYDVDFKQGAVLLVEPPVARSLKGDVQLLDDVKDSDESSTDTDIVQGDSTDSADEDLTTNADVQQDTHPVDKPETKTDDNADANDNDDLTIGDGLE